MALDRFSFSAGRDASCDRRSHPGSPGRDRPGGRPRTRFRPVLATLEGRTLLSQVITVTNTQDSGPGSLRMAIATANTTPGANRIVFAPGVAGTINLINGPPTITDDLTIAGPG